MNLAEETRHGEVPTWMRHLNKAKEKSPDNFPRDIKTAIKTGLIHAETPRTYTITRTGWNKIGQAVETLQ